MKNNKLTKSLAILGLSSALLAEVLSGCSKSSDLSVEEYIEKQDNDNTYLIKLNGENEFIKTKRIEYYDLKYNIKDKEKYDVYKTYGDYEPNNIYFYFDCENSDLLSVEYIFDDDIEYSINEIEEKKQFSNTSQVEKTKKFVIL